MKTLVLGATGATGKHLVDQFLERAIEVKVIVRSSAKIPEHWKSSSSLHIIEANVSEISVDEMAEYIKDCSSVASCLGHNITIKGLFGKPRRLVTDAVDLLCKAIKKNARTLSSIEGPEQAVRFALMSTTAYVNSDLNEPSSIRQRIVIGLVRLFLPPHVDNEKAADYLRDQIGQEDKLVEWVAIRPYTLINEEETSQYEVQGTPDRPAVLDSRKTRRINVSHFMAELITQTDTWNKWKGQLPVIFDKDSSGKN